MTTYTLTYTTPSGQVETIRGAGTWQEIMRLVICLEADCNRITAFEAGEGELK